MPSVVIIHAAEDALPARALAEKLRMAKLNPVIELPPGEELRAAVRQAPVVLALWSPRSVDQQPLLDEVASAKSKTAVIHARMQNTPTPDAFSGDPSIDLTGWRGENDFPGWLDLAKAVTAKAGVPAPPPPGPKGMAGFFTPGAVPDSEITQTPQQGGAPGPRPHVQRAPPPPPRAAPASAPRQAAPPPHVAASEGAKGSLPLMPIIIAAVLIVGGISGYFVWNSMQGSQAAQAWENLAQNDPAALRAFIAGHPGKFRDEAEQALATLEEQSFDAAREDDTVAAFESFLIDFPNSEHAIEARGRIAELNSMPSTEEAPVIEPLPDGATSANPDLLPPGAVTSEPTAPDTSAGGPAQLGPPATEPAPDAPITP